MQIKSILKRCLVACILVLLFLSERKVRFYRSEKLQIACDLSEIGNRVHVVMIRIQRNRKHNVQNKKRKKWKTYLSRVADSNCS
jgi:hypothetical protein